MNVFNLLTGDTSNESTPSLHIIDIVIIIIYFLAVYSIGFYYGLEPYFKKIKLFFLSKFKRNNTVEQQITNNDEIQTNNDTQQTSNKNFFLADNNTGWLAIGSSLFASNIGSEHFIGLASSGASLGLCVGMGEWISPIFILVLGWLFIPFYLKSKVYTLPEFIEKRFDRKCRMYLSCFSLIMYILTKISVSVYAGSIVFKVLLNWNIWVSATCLIISTGLYTITGGLKAVIYTEVLQTFILIISGTTVFVIGMIKVGGLSGLRENLPDSMMHLFQPPNHPDFPITGVIFGLAWTSMWYWNTDQVIVQRALSAKDLANATRGCIFASFIKVLPVFLMVFPGMIARVLIPEVQNDPNGAFILLVQKFVPVGLKGLFVAAMLAALMSSLASIFHSSSTLFTMDVYRVIKEKLRGRRSEVVQTSPSSTTPITITTNQQVVAPVYYNSTERLEEEENIEEPLENLQQNNELTINNQPTNTTNNNNDDGSGAEYVIVGKIAGIIITLFGVLSIPIVQLLSKQLYIYTHKVMGYCASPIAVIFLFGVLSKRVNNYGCFATLLVGNTIGLTRLFLEAILIGENKIFDVEKLPYWLGKLVGGFVTLSFLHFSAALALFSIICLYIISLLTGKPKEENIELLTLNYRSMYETVRNTFNSNFNFKTFIKENREEVINVLLTIISLGILVTLYIVFA
ncbi:hypothetical protein ABK040_005971 [Willaertia magna]